jgi:predicted phosphoribosyltransferase
MELFHDRVEAGRRLVSALKGTVGKDAIVLAIPRGGVVVGHVVARALGVPLDIIIPRKIGAPGNSELAIGAITEDGTTILDETLIQQLEISRHYIEEQGKKQKLEIERRLKLYKGNARSPILSNHEVVIVDDGIATGSTIKAALSSVRKRGAKKITIAVPVGPKTTIDELKDQADRVVCLFTPEPFYAIGQFYKNFDQTSDEEVRRLLRSGSEKP